MVNNVLVASDNFTRADENPLSNSGAWATQGGKAALKLTSDIVEATATDSNGGGMLYTGASFNNDQYSAMTIGSYTTSGYGAIVVRANTSNGNCYYAVIHGNTGSAQTDFNIAKVVGGVTTQLSANLPCTPQVGDVFNLSVISNVLYFYQNGNLLGQATDGAASIASGTPGINEYCVSALTDCQITAWSGGNASLPSTNKQSSVQTFWM